LLTRAAVSLVTEDAVPLAKLKVRGRNSSLFVRNYMKQEFCAVLVKRNESSLIKNQEVRLPVFLENTL
jgi:hypothetical protein